ncbi:MAG: hypothetical protein IJA36_11530 [Lachnospiraceae bacterium]|nr:hypothetical protein [Lachnospiraceae bacterium]
MDIAMLKEEFYQCIVEALKKFSVDENNTDVYVMAFDCDSSVGMISLRYRNRQQFNSELNTYEDYNKKYGWKIYGLQGSEYDPGEFEFINYQKTALVKHFLDSYYYHAVGEYYGEGTPIKEIKNNYKTIFWDMIVDTIQRLKEEMKSLGIHTTEKFIMFHCDHDQSYEEVEKMMRMTVESDILQSLREESK